MIQRVQSIYLLLASIMGVLTFFLPFAHFYAGSDKVAEYAMFGVFNVQSEMVEMSSPYPFPEWIFGVLAVLIPLIALFMYKNRTAQLKICRLAYLINLGFIVFLFFAVDSVTDSLFDESIKPMYHAGFYLPVAAIAFCFLANRGIKKDEELIKSIDRIR